MTGTENVIAKHIRQNLFTSNNQSNELRTKKCRLIIGVSWLEFT